MAKKGDYGLWCKHCDSEEVYCNDCELIIEPDNFEGEPNKVLDKLDDLEKENFLRLCTWIKDKAL